MQAAVPGSSPGRTLYAHFFTRHQRLVYSVHAAHFIPIYWSIPAQPSFFTISLFLPGIDIWSIAAQPRILYRSFWSIPRPHLFPYHEFWHSPPRQSHWLLVYLRGDLDIDRQTGKISIPTLKYTIALLSAHNGGMVQTALRTAALP